ncbi:pyrroline-5-carboxylate reductase [Candidatus Williamhamiltonella defendens]|uniref:pyrroline-5-carboxylate reductase n=1 Tax=Candidatus Williamhamiltonella defendens TaxID=138072 RepID=UPI00130DC887|nr:pyrroline-5-carboxylate reductase [Candidatus Hamiltonella defensa]
MKHHKIVFIGSGNITSAIVSGIVEKGYPSQKITVCAPSECHRGVLSKKWGVISSSDNAAAIRQGDVIIFSVKPQKIRELCQDLCNTNIDFSNKLILSVVTGISISRFCELLNAKLNLIRMMPNTPVRVHEGMTALFAKEEVNEADRHFTSELMCSVGKVCWLKNEADMNKVIAVSASAPAYFFLFMEAIEREALLLGFSQEKARLLVQQTARGVCALVEKSSALSLSELRQQVSSKGGTTEAAIEFFNKKQLFTIVSSAMKAAIAQAEFLEKNTF